MSDEKVSGYSEMENARIPNTYWWPGVFHKSLEYTTWWDEEVSWSRTASVWDISGPMGGPYWRVSGPDASRLLSDTCVNKIYDSKPGTTKQLVACRKDGKIIMDTLCLVMAPNVYEISASVSCFEYIREKGDYDVEIIPLPPRTAIQVSGPKSFELLQNLTDAKLTDIKFAHFNTASVKFAGCDAYLVRLTMTNELGFEIQVSMENHDAVYDKIFEIGEKYGIQRIGARNHLVQHMEAGIKGAFYCDAINAICDADDPYNQYLRRTNDIMFLTKLMPPKISGSFEGKSWSDYYASPIELGMGGHIDLTHDFPGREALAEELRNPKRKMVALEWNAEDVIDVYASMFRAGASHEQVDTDHYDYMEMPRDPRLPIEASKVLVNGQEIAFTTARTYCYSFRRMISHCMIPVKYSEVGTELTVIWGNPGHPQKAIRATVATVPYKPNRTKTLPTDK
jgi:vanillate/3-O-methylgallate O-demethylase